MKNQYLFLGTLLIAGLLTTNSLAQRGPSRFSNYDMVSSYRIGIQGINVNELNQALQQAGYGPLASQVPVLSLVSQFSRPGRAVGFHSEIGISFGSGLTATNGTYKARAGFFYAKLGGSYRIVGNDKFQLAPQLSLLALPYTVRISQANNATPSLNSILTNPGSAQTASVGGGSIGLDAGLTANLRIPVGNARQMDCFTIQRSVVIGLDAGYRVAARTPINGNHEVSTNNPGIQLSGWYAGLRLGLGQRVRSTISPSIN